MVFQSLESTVACGRARYDRECRWLDRAATGGPHLLFRVRDLMHVMMFDTLCFDSALGN